MLYFTHRIQRVALGLVAVTLLPVGVKPAAAHETAAEMAVLAQRFIATLDEDQKREALFSFKSDKRQFWHFVPDKYIRPGRRRFGLTIGAMKPAQRLLAHALLSSGLSHKGYQQATTIMLLESILHDLENKNPIRDPELYYLQIFGTPSVTKTWGWRFEGHHLSIGFTLVLGTQFSVTPSFFGTNPAEVKDGPLRGLKTLAAEEDLAREFVNSLSEEQKKRAIIAPKAPRDIFTGQDRKANNDAFLPPKGIPFAALTAAQRSMLLRIVAAYTRKYRAPVVDQITKRHKLTEGKDIYFAWAGGTKPGQGHYYRVQTAEFLFEYDNVQNKANHVHAVWRHFDGDFGEDLLRKHYENAHRPLPDARVQHPSGAGIKVATQKVGRGADVSERSVNGR